MMEVMRMISAAVCAATTMVCLSSIAGATPENFPDLSTYQQVNPENYGGEFSYATAGVRFRTPDGLHCSLSRNMKASSSVASCRGKLPGANGATGVMASTFAPTTWQQVDLGKPETYQEMRQEGSREVPLDPSAFKPLPAGSRITYQNISCAVSDAVTTACIIGSAATTFDEHGFVLQPGGSWIF